MTQSLALLVDAYRELNARKMFWISLIISAVFMIGFALLGVNDQGLTIVGIKLPIPEPMATYKVAFSYVVIGFWISWVAMILALISTASIFPDLLAGGSIDLYLSKPMSRLRLFLTKYLGGLLFVALQTAIFAVGSFLTFGLRAGQWRPSLFLIIPLGTLLFSYLFAISTFIGVWTRSTIAAILITIPFWFICAVGNRFEQGIFGAHAIFDSMHVAYERQAKEAESDLAFVRSHPSDTPMYAFREQFTRERADELRKMADDSGETARKMNTVYRISHGIVTVIPKTKETIDLLDHALFDNADFKRQAGEEMESGSMFGPPPKRARNRGASRTASEQASSQPTTSPTTQPSKESIRAAEERRREDQDAAAADDASAEMVKAIGQRSKTWVIGTSLGFEAVILALAAWVFCRRDY